LYYKENPPEETLKNGRVLVTTVRVFPQPGRTYILQWREEQQDQQGIVVRKVDWQARVEVAVIPPKTRAERQRNDTGVWIANLAWSPL
jgi:type IV secretory pathway TrbF-like protein